MFDVARWWPSGTPMGYMFVRSLNAFHATMDIREQVQFNVLRIRSLETNTVYQLAPHVRVTMKCIIYGQAISPFQRTDMFPGG